MDWVRHVVSLVLQCCLMIGVAPSDGSGRKEAYLGQERLCFIIILHITTRIKTTISFSASDFGSSFYRCFV